MIRLWVTILLLGGLCTPVFGASTAKERLKSATSDGPMPGYTWEKDESAKSRLKATTSDGPMEGYTWEKSGSAKKKLNEATDAAPSYGTFESDKSACSCLTKPSVREDGGGLCGHAGGSVVCHLGRIMYCSAGVWNDRGNCDWPQERHAYWIEGSPPPGTPPKEGGPGEPGGGNKDGGSGASQGGQGILLGENPREQQLEKERQQLIDEVRQLRQMQQDSREGQRQGAPPQQGVPPQGTGSPQTGTANRMPLTGGDNAPTCAQAKEALAVIDQNMRGIETYSRGTTTVPGAIHPIYKDLYNASLKDRARAEQFMREHNCN